MARDSVNVSTPFMLYCRHYAAILSNLPTTTATQRAAFPRCSHVQPWRPRCTRVYVQRAEISIQAGNASRPHGPIRVCQRYRKRSLSRSLSPSTLPSPRHHHPSLTFLPESDAKRVDLETSYVLPRRVPRAKR